MGKDQVKFVENFYCTILSVGNTKFEDLENLFNFIGSNSRKPLINIDSSVNTVEFKTLDKFNTGVCMFYRINGQRSEVDFKDHEELETVPTNSEVSVYDYNTAIGRLIQQIAHERFFHELRTTEELGYVVYCAVKHILSSEYLVFVVQSEKSIDFLEQRILKFVIDLKTHISEMDSEEFESHKESLIGFYEEPIVNLEDLSTAITNQLTKGNIDLNYDRKMVEIVKKLTKQNIGDSDILNEYVRVNSIKHQ
ncbi:uncharacterized protein VICG_00641 [Vittaforma corneae ATCC 50505]|uniref:Coenzyme PQQ synthesis protein F-like C-terminal lobe domain-containing protein n=1 Tax=Vittaforma corneae (strain ATCC 50505) TaxID=993615 RepID=L2GPK8_VITCO|nr:uncharacterized protein VICG_00641 [Vittaforma corneae ATCC 50505]ELA42242.1 hypothetical protein VICG_00641 [Vittaforma corneae ATCC 50505]